MKLREQDWILIGPSKQGIVRGPVPSQELQRRVFEFLKEFPDMAVVVIEETRMVIVCDPLNLEEYLALRGDPVE